MKLEINKKLLPIKAHYFFFMACLGPILPQINVFGRQLGVSPSIMGILLSVLPVFYFFAKPLIGMLADYFTKARKLIFLSIVAVMAISFGCYIFLPHQPSRQDFNQTEVQNCDVWTNMHHEKCVNFHKVSCVSAANIASFQVLTIQSESILCHNKNVTTISVSPNNASFICRSSEDTEAASCFYKTWTFWGFVLLTFTGTVFFNVGNSISDAICFDVLGEEKQSKYGKQRVWGSIGFGIASLLAGYAVDLHTNDFTPAVLILMAFASIDLLVLSRLNLPKPTPSESIFKDVGKLLRHRKIVIFLVFATIVGMFDSFIFYYMFWHLEEVAERTHMKDHIKLIEGITVAAECIFGEVLFFMISGKIIKKLGYIHCMSFCLLCYAMRLFMISLIPNPWYLIGIEILMQGCTYALCYTCIVSYASVISPTGTSATVQGLVAGMDDGLGFSIGALFGGFLYQSLGGQQSFKVFALIALVTFIAHVILRPSSTHELKAPAKLQQTDSISPNPQDSKEAAQENSKLTEDC